MAEARYSPRSSCTEGAQPNETRDCSVSRDKEKWSWKLSFSFFSVQCAFTSPLDLQLNEEVKMYTISLLVSYLTKFKKGLWSCGCAGDRARIQISWLAARCAPRNCLQVHHPGLSRETWRRVPHAGAWGAQPLTKGTAGRVHGLFLALSVGLAEPAGPGLRSGGGGGRQPPLCPFAAWLVAWLPLRKPSADV